MNSNFSSIPLSCENNGEPPIFLSNRSFGHVVESAAAPGAGLHADEHERAAEGFSLDELHDERHNLHDERRNLHDREPGALDHGAPADHDDHDDRRAIRERDKFDREVSRARAQRERVERNARRHTQSRSARGRRALARTRHVDVDVRRRTPGSTHLQRGQPRRRSTIHDSNGQYVPVGDHLDQFGGVTNVATYSDSVKRFSSGPLHGTALAIYFVLLPYVVITKWTLTQHETNGLLVRVLLVMLSVFWLAFIGQVGHNIVRLRRGLGLASGGSAWLAGLIVAILPFLIPATASAGVATQRAPSISASASDSPWLASDHATVTPVPVGAPSPPRAPLSVIGALPMALMAKRRHDLLRQQQFEPADDQIDDVIELLRSYDPELVAHVRFLTGIERSGVIHVTNSDDTGEVSYDTDPVVACALSQDDEGLHVAFAREGGQLAIDASWSGDDVRATVVALHDGRLVYAENETELLRALATRALRNTMVVFLGSARDLDEELLACCVTLLPIARTSPTGTFGFARSSRDRDTAPSAPSGAIRVELLRADPQISGLLEPFTPTLRRRCVEMVAYLALHRGEPITGDRLRSRVLSHADVDASNRTLANVASAVRRSLGTSAQGPRLHPVTSSGLYATHGVTSDVEIFHTLVSRARALEIVEAAPLAHEALLLVHGEPLASALRGFEWFLAEGHNASLQRDGEWAALLVHHDAMNTQDFETAFWALQQGLLVDPYSDVLIEALARVPRLRQFGGDRAGGAQHEPVRAGGAVAVGWSFNRLGDEVAQ